MSICFSKLDSLKNLTIVQVKMMKLNIKALKQLTVFKKKLFNSIQVNPKVVVDLIALFQLL